MEKHKQLRGMQIEQLAKGIRIQVIDELIKDLEKLKRELKCPICSEQH